MITSNKDRLRSFMAGQGSEELLWFFAGQPVCANAPEREAFAKDRERFTGFRYVAPPILRRNATVEIKQRECDGVTTIERRTSKGSLIGRTKLHHPVDYPVKNLDDLHILKEVEASTEIALDASKVLDYDQIVDRISVNPSPIQRLIEYEMGVQTFWFLYHDHPQEILALIVIMLEKYLQECALIADLPVAAVRLVENTSTTLISPTHYRELSAPHIREAVNVFHSRGKHVAVHMCGLLRDLLPHFRVTGMDGIHSLTPPPVGNVSFEMVYESLGDSFGVEGRLGTICWLGKSREEIRQYLRGLIRLERIRRSPFILEVHSDGMPNIPFAQYLAVREAIESLF